MPEIAERMDGVGSGFAKFFAAPPPDVIRFTVGEPDFNTPAPIVEAAIQALRDHDTHYTLGPGRPDLLAALAERFNRFNGIPARPEDIVVTPGAKQALLYTWLSLSNPGDEVIILTPAWPSHETQVTFASLTPVLVATNPRDFHPDLAAIEAAITDRTRFILVNSPNNPTGATYTRAELEGIARLCVEHDLWLVSDEIYDTMVWTDEGHHSPASWDWAAANVITIGGFSKTWAMTGWRIGVMTGPSQVMAAVKQCQANAATHIPSFSMPAALAALGPEALAEVDGMLDEFRERRSLIMGLLDGIPQLSAPEPEGAFYAFVDVAGTGMTDLEFAQRAMDEARVQLIPGSLMPGGAGYVRISYATSREAITEGMERLRAWLARVAPLEAA